MTEWPRGFVSSSNCKDTEGCRGDVSGPGTPGVEALRGARDLEALMREHGTMLGMFVGGTRYCGERGRGPGRP